MGIFGSLLLYYGVFIFTGISAHVTSKKKLKSQKYYWCLFWTWIIPSFFAGIRYGIGTDYLGTYTNIFNTLNYNINSNVRTEILYTVLNKTVIIMGGNLHHVMFIMALLTNILAYKSLEYYKQHISVGFGMFFYMLLYYQASYNTVRQALAIVIILYSTQFILKKDFWKFFICALIAVGFHISALCILPFYFIADWIKQKKKRKWAILLFTFLLVVILNYDKILTPIIINIPSLNWYISYLNKGELKLSAQYYIYLVPVFLPLILIYNKFIKKDDISSFFLNFTILGCLIYILQFMNTNYFSRLSDYFLIMRPMLFGTYIKYFNKMKNAKIWITLFIIMMVMINIYFYFIANYGATVPFVFGIRN